MSIKENDAVSPVVGVMLMLVVTIIIAAVISGFAGGLAENKDRAPTATFEIKISNDGSWGGSGINIRCLSVEEPIPTKDLKIVTQWRDEDGVLKETVITKSDSANTHYDGKEYMAPLGFGPGVQEWVTYGTFPHEQNFGNYTLMAGTNLHTIALGSSVSYGGYGVDPTTRFEYTDGTGWTTADDIDGMMAMLGEDWYELRQGDVVKVKIVHVPTGGVIFEKDAIVEL